MLLLILTVKRTTPRELITQNKKPVAVATECEMSKIAKSKQNQLVAKKSTSLPDVNVDLQQNLMSNKFFILFVFDVEENFPAFKPRQIPQHSCRKRKWFVFNCIQFIWIIFSLLQTKALGTKNRENELKIPI